MKIPKTKTKKIFVKKRDTRLKPTHIIPLSWLLSLEHTHTHRCEHTGVIHPILDTASVLSLNLGFFQNLSQSFLCCCCSFQRSCTVNLYSPSLLNSHLIYFLWLLTLVYSWARGCHSSITEALSCILNYWGKNITTHSLRQWSQNWVICILGSYHLSKMGTVEVVVM